MTTTASRENYPDLIDLDVGGKHFRTTHTTLAVPDSMLQRLVSDHWKEGTLKGAISVDRNPEAFQIVLDYLRTSTIAPHLPTDQDQRKRLLLLLQNEAEYFQLTDLTDTVSASLANLKALALANFPEYMYVRFFRARLRFGSGRAYQHAIVPDSTTYADGIRMSMLGRVGFAGLRALEKFVKELNLQVIADGQKYRYVVSGSVKYCFRDEFSVQLSRIQ
ncbi:BTB/POZ domain-containing protein kctd8 [Rhizophlyctis rosea]|uniref:BTB/POZ domain-containing protein kctd8 n=1 Tax=Rhizophlyctis rosea TaxID=64517 RepID=A0AAD5X7Z4_9FUNG|nr:BTB/POZ domain-containing protein kctd8 [Rhizophlyctis rosea]